MDRERQIVRVSVVSIVGNALLAVAKGIVGLTTGSIAIALDAVNSLADALGSVIAIIGTKLAGRSANREHPFGFGRFEYLSSILIAAIILSAGVSSFVEAVRAILHPKTPSYTVASLVVVAVAALVKYGLGYYMKREGKRLGSGALVGSGTDSFMDGCVSMATFLAGVLFLTLGWQIESWLAAGIALLIVKSGTALLLETASKLLGERVSPEVAEKVEQEVRSIEEVRLASGLVLLDFGPDRLVGAIHVTVDGRMTVSEFDRVARAVQSHVFEETGVMLAGVTPYPDVSHDDSARDIRSIVGRIVWGHDHVVDLRGLFVNPDTRSVRFDAIVDYGVKDRNRYCTQITEACENGCPGWSFDVRVIPDVGD